MNEETKSPSGDELSWTPLRLIVVAPLAGHQSSRPKGPIRIAADDLDGAVERVAPSLSIKIAGAPLSLEFRKRRDFDPKEIWAQAAPQLTAGGALKGSPDDRALRTPLLDAIVHHPDFAKLESAWLGLAYLAKRGEAGIGRLVPLQLDALVTGIGEEWTDRYRAQIFDPDYEGTSEVAASALLIDQEVDHQMASIERLHLLGELAAAIQTPVAASVGPAMFGLKNLAHLPSLPDLATKTFGGPWAGWNLFQRENAARWVSLSVNRFLLRAPYGGGGSDAFYNETVDPAHPEWLAWGSPIWALGVSLAASYSQHGHCAAADGLSGTGGHRDLPTRELQQGPMTRVVVPTEVILPDEKAWDLCRAGFTPLVGQQNGDIAYFPFLATSYRHAPGSVTLDQALTYQLYAGQVSHRLLALSGRLPAGDPTEVCRWLEHHLFAELSPFVGDAPGTHVQATPIQLPDGKIVAAVKITPTFKIQEKPLEFEVQLPLR